MVKRASRAELSLGRGPAKGRARRAGPPPANNRASKQTIRCENVARILEAAEAVFATKGFSGATTAEIATRAGIPKPNLHYYFRTKQALYRAVLDDILALWLDATASIVAEAEPADALRRYIEAKMAYSRTRPFASKVFANELLHGAPAVKGFLGGAMKRLVDDKAKVIEGWITAGRIAPIDPYHLFFVLWAATQTYADFDCQIAAVLGKKKLGPTDFDRAGETVATLILRGLRLKV
ncbi:MAG: TetR/AcrR family transcriptional regulator [Alphaproteobacteria bacterium]|nr:TetR/AcrR family transcriptional regulator [Alphaproteobacteria bacterium]